MFDVLVIGSGASGGWVAKEAHRAWSHRLDAGSRAASRSHPRFHRAHLALPAEISRLRRPAATSSNQPVQRLCYACDEYSHQFFVNDLEHPYTFPADKPFMWIRGRQVGGKTFCWARESYRFSDNEFKAASRDGYGEDWPISYKELEPYYDRVESYIGVSGSREGLSADCPTASSCRPWNLSCGGVQAKESDRSANLAGA